MANPKSNSSESHHHDSNDDDMVDASSVMHEHDDANYEDDDESLRRLSHQAQRRRGSSRPSDDSVYDTTNDGDDDIQYVEEEDDDDDDDEEIEPAEFLRRIMDASVAHSSRGHGNSGGNSNDDNEDEEEEDDEDEEDDDHSNHNSDPRSEFLRAIGAIPRGGGSGAATAAGSDRAQGFVDAVQRLMGGGIMFGGTMQRDTQEMEALINNLNQRDDTYIILETLNELSERLLMMNGITAERLIPANKLAKSLVNLMVDPALSDELELHLVACRCLYNFLEVNQDFIHEALNSHAIEALCGKLLEISYIDLTEQALQTLEMISRDTIAHNSIIANDGLRACLLYLDFLTIHAQRKCLAIVSNSCTNISVSNFSKVKDIIDNISEVVQNHNDTVVVENAWLTISRIIISFKSKPELLEELFSQKAVLLKSLTQTIYSSCNKSSNSAADSDSSKVALNYSSCLSLIKSLIILSSVSVGISNVLFTECSIGEIIVKSVNKYSKTKQRESPVNGDDSFMENISSISIEAVMAAPKEIVSQFLNLIGYLLPITYAPSETPFLNEGYEFFEEKSKVNALRIELCRDIIPQDYERFVNDVYSFLIVSFQSSMDFEIRRKVFINLYRIITSSYTNNFDPSQVESISNLLASVVNNSKGSIAHDFALISKINEVQEDIDMASEAGDRDEVEEEVVPFNDDHMEEDEEDDEDNEEDEDNDDDEEDDEDDEDDEEEIEDVIEEDEDDIDESNSNNNSFSRQSIRKNSTQDNSKLNSNVLLLMSLNISKTLLERNPVVFIQAFEREGLLNDAFIVLQSLKGKVAYEKPERSRMHSYSSSYANKFIDAEFTRDYEIEITSDKVYFNIEQVSATIENLYRDAKLTANYDNIPKHMKILESVMKTLDDHKLIKSFDLGHWKELWETLCSALDDADQLSSFELISCGIIDSLAYIFTSDNFDFGFEFNDCYRSFISVFFGDRERSSVQFLVSKLQEVLTRCESFDIISSGANQSGTGGSVYHSENQTTVMAKQIKLKLTSDDDNNDKKLPTNMQNMILSVHAIATFKSVDSFLKQRIKFVENLSELGRVDPLGFREEAIQDDSKKNPLNLEFLINEEVIPNEITIYGAIYRSLQTRPDEIIDPSRIWSTVHNVTYRKVSSEVSKESKSFSYKFNVSEDELDVYDKTTISVLKLLKVLFEMNQFVRNNIPKANVIRESDFMNWKLTVKLNRQLEEPLVVASGTLPGWSIHVTKQFPFIFPLETRIFFLQSTSFGYSRLIHHWQIKTNQAIEDNNGHGGSSNQNVQLGRPTRHKVRISRKMILQSAVKVLGLYGSTPGILEIEYFDEVGSGLGPTLEFYATISKEFSKKMLKLWRDDGNSRDVEYVSNKLGLFPAPMDKPQLNSDNGKKVLYFFSSLGKFIARALLDSRIIDFNFNPNFLKLVQSFNYGSQKSGTRNLKKLANFASLRLVDAELANSLEHLLKYVKLFPTVNQKDRDSIMVDGATLKDLEIYFELPGYPEYDLMSGGKDIRVDSSNVELYVGKVIEATLYTGIIHQTKAFMEGFSKVFPIDSLILFSPNELVGLFGNAEEDWSLDTLTSAVNANHGYTKESESIKSLISILVSFTDNQRRAFLQFLTGSPKLPIGGFKALRPELTVVRKHGEGGLTDDDYLPSVMTCANYFKLPKYSSKELMKERLLQAINEGAGAFLLS
ncbi:ubiquitin--protein ligase [Scheffersomyces coipomensis]|uniref:ubiquitin--protein ligase n=1 Tax=Scheffersomyces coipomensis TaxID=1788519 RepID=UPI00315C8B8E